MADPGPAVERTAAPTVVPAARWRQAFRLALLWVAVLTLVFATFAVIERVWLAGASRQSLEHLHMARGIAASLLTTVAIAAMLLRRTLPSLDATPGAEAQSASGGETAREKLVRWLVGLRWIAVVGAAAAVLLAGRGPGRVSDESLPLLWAGVLALGLFNAAVSILGIRRGATPAALTAQVAFDVVVLGWFVHHAGGVRNPFTAFFVFHAVIAAVVLEPRRARRVIAAIGSFVLLITAAEAAGLRPGCLRDAGGACGVAADWVLLAGSGGAIGALVLGCGFASASLVEMLWRERSRLSSAQADAQRQRESLQAIVDCMADAVVFVTPDGIVRLRNRAARRFWPSETDPGADLRACHRPEKWAELRDRVTQPGAFEAHPLLEAAGRAYEASYAAVRDPAGQLGGVVMVARDITDRIEAQRLRSQEERMAVVGKLAAGLAHELNNPLASIALFAQHALQRVEPGHPLADHLGTVLRNADLCKKIVRDLLEYARQRPPERRRVELPELLGDVLRTLEPQAQASKVQLAAERVPAGTPTAFGDPDQLRQVLVNLGLNAIEAMSGGGRLTFRAAPAGARIAVDVEDTGPGIPEEEHDRIFSAFHTTKPEGTGLGLTVARDLVSAHGGEIRVRSAPGAGSTFTVELPSAATAEKAAS